jgi:ATP-dependent DNA ligase
MFGDVRLVSRNRNAFIYPELVDALKLLSVKNAIIDDEITVLDQNGKSSFQLLQSYGKTKRVFEKSCQCQAHRMRYKLHASCPEAGVSTYSTNLT